MCEKHHDIHGEVVLEFTRKLYRGLAECYGGDCTLNELRVMNQIILCQFKGRFCSVTALHQATAIPLPTVSRCVCNLRRKGWLDEQAHPDDGRRRIISLSSDFLRIARREIGKKADWLNNYWRSGYAENVA